MLASSFSLQRSLFCFVMLSCFNLSSSNIALLNKTFEGRILGGTPVSIEKIPSSIIFFNEAGMCSATVLNSWSAVTAAHCFDHNTDIEEMILLAGARYTYDRTADVYQVSHFEIHANYNKLMRFSSDIALLFVTTPIVFGNKVKKAIIVNHGNWMNRRNKEFQVAGWGQVKYGGPLSGNGLLSVTLRFIPSKECGRLHKLNLTTDMFCLYGEGVRDSCKGDSGSGVQWNRMLVGIVSHGDGCGNKGKPGVYANVWYFKTWIQNTIRNFGNKYCRKKM